MSSMWDDIVMGARVANSFFKGAQKVGKMAKDGMQSEKFQNLKADLQNKAANSETLQNLSAELKQRVSQVSGEASKTFCTQCGTLLSPNARFCSQCGAPQPQQETPTTPASPDSRVQMLVKKPGKNPAAFLGKYHFDKPGYNLDLMILKDGDLIRISFLDYVSGEQRYESFDDWLTGGNGLYCHAPNYSFRFFMEEDGSITFDNQEVFPSLEGRYSFLG